MSDKTRIKSTADASIQETPAAYSSPPCFMHELDSSGQVVDIDAQAQKDVARWRRSERERLIAERLAVSADDRRRKTDSIIDRMNDAIGDAHGKIISTYWPFRGEPDLRLWMESVTQRGGICALPVVVQKAAPLIFRAWRQGEALEKGVWNIPIPANGPDVIPDIVIAPVVGFDRSCYRLGYGGGFFDRTLATFGGRALAIGIGYASQEIRTIYPQPYDIAMRVVLTEAETIKHDG